MTEQILSPGVYSSEIDQSYIPPGQVATGLAIVGPTEKGAAYVPTDVTSYADFVSKFGTNTGETYVPQAVYNYLQAGSTAKVTRVLGNGGFVFNTTRKVAAIVSGSKIISVLFPSKNDNAATAALNSSSIPSASAFNNFVLTLSGSQITTRIISASLSPTDNNYLLKMIGTDENYATSSAYPYIHFANYFTGSVTPAASASGSLIFNGSAITFTSSYAEGYDAAKTPWILSDSGVRLFRFVHRSHGFKTNKDIKISIANISKNTDSSIYSTFDILVRAWNDTDRTPSVIEQYSGVSLDPDAANYIGKKIGDKYSDYDETLLRVLDHGYYPNISKYVRVEIDGGVEAGSVTPNLIPVGFEAIYEPIAGFSGYTLPSASFVFSTTSSTTYSGFNFANSDNTNYLNPIPTEAGTGSNVPFTKTTNENKFTIPFQGGTDGTNFAVIKKIGEKILANGTNVFGFDLSTSTTGGTAAYQKAINILSNPEAYSFGLLTLPGIIEQYHSAVTALAETMCENRTDAVYIRDLTGPNETIATAVATAAGLDSNYSATYHPWVLVKDIGSNKSIFIPPSVIVPQAYAYNDAVAEPWFAPAGIGRGGLGGAIDTKYRLYKADRDTLYQARINPLIKSNNNGVSIFGQKTLQVADTALNRINVRRLLIALRSFVVNASNAFVFEQNTNNTQIKLRNILNPFMENVKQKQGLYAYRVQVDDSNNTSDVIDRNQLVVNIYLSPTKTIEFILLSFSINGSGVTFN